MEIQKNSHSNGDAPVGYKGNIYSRRSIRKIDRTIYLLTDTTDGWSIATVDISQIDIQITISKLSNNTNVLTVPRYLTKLISWMLSNKGISNNIR